VSLPSALQERRHLSRLFGETSAFGSTSDQTSPARRLGIPSGSHQVVAHEVTREPVTPMIGRFDWARSDSKGPSLQSCRLKSNRTARTRSACPRTSDCALASGIRMRSHQLPGAKLGRLVESTAPGEGSDSLGLKQSNFTCWSGCVGQSSISGQQCASEPFGQGNIGRVVGGDVGSELVGPSE
jgi:hypothetical protein